MNFRNILTFLALACACAVIRADDELPKEAVDQVKIISSQIDQKGLLQVRFHNTGPFKITTALLHVTIPGTNVDWDYAAGSLGVITRTNEDGLWTVGTGLQDIDKKNIKIQVAKIYWTKS